MARGHTPRKVKSLPLENRQSQKEKSSSKLSIIFAGVKLTIGGGDKNLMHMLLVILKDFP